MKKREEVVVKKLKRGHVSDRPTVRLPPGKVTVYGKRPVNNAADEFYGLKSWRK